jgi:protein gp37
MGSAPALGRCRNSAGAVPTGGPDNMLELFKIKNTKIQWCDSTVNPTMGCDGCELWNTANNTKICYAGILHDRYGGKTKGYSPTFDEVTTWSGRMRKAAGWPTLSGTVRADKPWLDGLPRLIFVSDMSDALSSGVTFEYLLEEVIGAATSGQGSRHQYLWLTKRPRRMAEFSRWLENKGGWPENIWAGTSVTSNAVTSRIPPLLDVGNDSTIRFISVEPQFEEISLSEWLPQLDWIIQGGASGAKATTQPFDITWARNLIRACSGPGMPSYFLKQLGSRPTNGLSPIVLRNGHGGDWAEWPEDLADLKVREMPISPSIPVVNPANPAVPSSVAPIALVSTDIGIKRRRHEAAVKAWATRRRNANSTAKSLFPGRGEAGGP